MKVSDIVISFLESKNVDTVFTVSGGGCIHLIDSLRKSEAIKTYCPHHEQSALMASEGYYRMKGKISANVVTTGPGGTNTITGLLGLWLDSIPTIVISGQVPSNQLSAGTGCRQIGDQEFDIISVVKPMTKYATMITDPKQILTELEKAYHIALEGRPGPVWIDIPLDIQGFNLQEVNNNFINNNNKLIANESSYQHLYSLLNNSKRPLIIIGNGIRLSHSFEKLNEFLNRLNIPIVTGPHSGVDCVDNTYRYYSGRIGILGQQTSNRIVQEADLLLCLGTRLPVKMTGYNIKEFSPGSKKIFVDIDENEIKKHQFTIDLFLNTDIKDFFDNFQYSKLHLNIEDWKDEVLKIRKEQKYYHKKHKELKTHASFYYLIDQAPEIFKDIPIITSNGTAHVITLQMYRLNKNQRLFTNVGCASMGYGLPAAIGACIGNENKDVLCIEGDGSLMMNLQELQTVVNYNLPIKTIIINNEGYLSIKLSQESFFAGKEFASGPDNGVTLPNYKKISEAFGIPYYSIKDNNSIHEVLNESIQNPGPAIIEVFTHPKEKHEPKVTHKGVDEMGKIIPGTLTDMFISDTF